MDMTSEEHAKMKHSSNPPMGMAHHDRHKMMSMCKADSSMDKMMMGSM